MTWHKFEKLLFTLAALGTGCWAIASIFYPMGYDQGMMASVGDVIVRGGMPYRQGFDLKGPLTFYVFALVQTLVGRAMWGIRLLDLGLLIIGSACFYSVLKRILDSPVISRWLALSLVLAAASRSWFHVSQPDGWAAAFVIVAVWISLRFQASRLAWIAAGALVGASALIKPFFILFLAVPVVIGASGGFVALILPAVLTTLGAAIPILMMAGWFEWNGALNDLIAVHVKFNLEAYSGVDPLGLGGVIEHIISYLWNGAPKTPAGPFGVLLIPIVVGAVIAGRQRRALDLGLLVWLATALACLALQRKFYVYQWLIAFPPLLAVAGLGLARLSTQTATRVFAAVAIGLFVAGIAIRPAWDTFRFVKYASGIESREDYLYPFERFDYRPLWALDAASHIKTHTRPDETVAVFGVDAIVQYLSERQSPTRFVFSLPLNVPNKSYRDRYRAEFIGDLRQGRPRYIVLGTHEDETTTPSRFPELAELLTERYRFDQKFGELDLYRLDDNLGSAKR